MTKDIDTYTVLITGADGFIGKNLSLYLNQKRINVLKFTRKNSTEDLNNFINQADYIVHLAGENRPIDISSYWNVNVGLTKKICKFVKQQNTRKTIIFASSSQVSLDNDYGNSKLAAERELTTLASSTNCSVRICRLNNVFGKWCRPNYNSVVATFCNNLHNDVPLRIDDPHTELTLNYVDDVCEYFFSIIEASKLDTSMPKDLLGYRCTVRDLADILTGFHAGRRSGVVGDTGSGLARALYATYISYLPVERFSLRLDKFSDERGMFVEFLKSNSSGQISYFTAEPGITRGGHYHHSKSEKFLVVQGKALFRLECVISKQVVELEVSSSRPTVIDIPVGWWHAVTNLSNDRLICVVWANEIFDRNAPDTYTTLP